MGLPKLESPKGHSAWDYGDSVIHFLAEIKEAVENGRGDDPINRRIAFNFQADPSGAGQQELQIPRGVKTQVIGISFIAGAAGDVSVYANEVSGFTLLMAAPCTSTVVGKNVTEYSELFLDDADQKFVVVGSNLGAGQQVTGHLRIRQYESNEQDPKEAV